MAVWLSRFVGLLRRWPATRVFRHRDFRLIWFGALVSFTGSQIQMVAQGAYVYDITGQKTALGLVNFFAMIPVTLLSPISGVLVDLLDRRKILIGTSITLFIASAFNAFQATINALTFFQIAAVALIGGLVQCIEPTSRQTIVREVVGEDDIAQAIPLQSMTFNIARAVGPAVGGIIAGVFGFAICFWINSLSFLAMIFAAVSLKTRVEPRTNRHGPIKDLIFEGLLFTVRDRSLFTLLLMEGLLSLFGIFYMSQMPAIAEDMLGLDPRGLGFCYTAVGIGALCGLTLTVTISHRPLKGKIVLCAMAVFGACLALVSFTRRLIFAAPFFALMGAGSIAQFNTTNTLFQLLSPPALRGRVLSMHMWAISGLAPIGSLLMGGMADHVGLPETLLVGGILVSLGAVGAFVFRGNLREPQVSGA